jgi:hypothetical protein
VAAAREAAEGGPQGETPREGANQHHAAEDAEWVDQARCRVDHDAGAGGGADCARAGFNPILTGRENIYINGSVLGLTKKEIDEKIDEIIDFAEIREFIDMPVQSYSSGMAVRLGFAVATALDPSFEIVKNRPHSRLF